MFFSNNLSEERKLELSTKLGIKQTSDLSRYLGHYIQYQGGSNKANSQLLQRMRGRLDGWKTKCLSIAGRLTLAKSVINRMSIFQMQVHKLPAGVHKELDRYVRRCMWGESNGVKNVHLLSWETLCKPIEYGGFWFEKSRRNEQRSTS